MRVGAFERRLWAGVEFFAVIAPIAIVLLFPWGFIAAVLWVPLAAGLMIAMTAFPWLTPALIPRPFVTVFPFAVFLMFLLYNRDFYIDPRIYESDLLFLGYGAAAYAVYYFLAKTARSLIMGDSN